MQKQKMQLASVNNHTELAGDICVNTRNALPLTPPPSSPATPIVHCLVTHCQSDVYVMGTKGQ